MHPNVYLKTFWRTEIRPEIFVAMSFSGIYENRFQEIIKPAIEGIKIGNTDLKAKRVDLSKTGDSILTEIIDGIAHCEMVLVDVSTQGHDSKTGDRYRNGNVMYELGLALACRQPSEVLLIRDDHDKLLFDVSVIPHKRVDFTNAIQARDEIREEIQSRLRERDHLRDARVQLAVNSLTAQEMLVLRELTKLRPEEVFSCYDHNLQAAMGLSRLLDKQLIVTAGVSLSGHVPVRLTRLGSTVAQNLKRLVPLVYLPQLDESAPDVQNPKDEPRG